MEAEPSRGLSPRARRALVIAAVALYPPAFLATLRALGPAAGALVSVPVLLAAEFLGLRAGLAASLLAVPLNALLFHLTGYDWLETLTRGAPGLGALTLVALAVGWSRTARDRLASELAERRRTERALLESEATARALMDTPMDPMLLLDAAGLILDLNRAASLLLGGDREALLGRRLCEAVAPEAAARWRERVEHVHRSGRMLRFEDRYGGRWLDIVISPISGSGGQVARLAVHAHDITELKRLEEQVLRESFYDPLTGLPNRALLVDRLRHTLKRSAREGRGFALLVLGLDRLDDIAETLGHPTADEVITRVAWRLQEHLRAGDTLARLQAGEFAVLAEGVREVSEAIRVGERLLAAVREPLVTGGDRLSTTASLGIVLCAVRDEDPYRLLSDAHLAMRQARARGGDRYELYTAHLRSDVLARWELERELRQAVEKKAFLLHYQPVVCLRTGRVAGLEALLRWRHPRRGVLTPAAFLPLAEATDLIVTLDRWVLQEACRQASTWIADRAAAPWISVNLSASHTRYPDLPQAVQRVIADTDLPGERLVLELTETAFVSEEEAVGHVLRGLRQLGVQLAIDDFGTGYASLSRLNHLPVDTLKIGRPFVAGLDTDPRRVAIVEAVTTLAHRLGMKVVVEGVETEGQLGALRDLGCEYAQGYLFSRPVDERAAGALLKQDFRALLRGGAPAT